MDFPNVKLVWNIAFCENRYYRNNSKMFVLHFLMVASCFPKGLDKSAFFAAHFYITWIRATTWFCSYFVNSFSCCCSLKGNLDPVLSSWRGQACQTLVKVKIHCADLTFVEALLTVHDGDPEAFETGGPMELTMVLVQLPIRPTHRFIMWFAVVQALTVPLTSLMVDHTVLAQTTILVLTRTRIATVSHKSCKTTNK